jgi:hypothetical protein
VDIDDDDEEDDELAGIGEDDVEEEDGEKPIFSSQQQHRAQTSSSKATAASYSYRDVFGKDYDRRRQQQIDAKVSIGYKFHSMHFTAYTVTLFTCACH